MSEIFHITTRSAWASAQANGQYVHPSLQAEGFIHCSRKDQVIRVANALFRSREDLIVLKICTTRLRSPLRDDCTDSGEVYPHIYGHINTEAVESSFELFPETDGTFSWQSNEDEADGDILVPMISGSEAVFPQMPA